MRPDSQVTPSQPPGAAPSLLAIDAGQTGIKARYRDPDGAATEWSLPGVRTDLPLMDQLRQVLDDAAARVSRVQFVGFGVSGLTVAESRPDVLLQAARGLGTDVVTLAHDSITAYLAALRHERGAVVAAGTGSVTLAVGRRTVARVDGWGNLMGDAGSGYWIGRAAFEAVMRAFDGRGPATALLPRLQQDFPQLDAAYIELQADPGRVKRIASYARCVTDLAATDEVAAGIVDRAAAELAHAAVTGLRLVEEDSEAAPLVHAVGGVFTAECTLTAFRRHVTSALPGAVVTAGHTDALNGAECLIDLPADSPLRAHLQVARA
jgi:N-acetylglucosamine kinase-like BadF-type ATPase